MTQNDNKKGKNDRAGELAAIAMVGLPISLVITIGIIVLFDGLITELLGFADSKILVGVEILLFIPIWFITFCIIGAAIENAGKPD